ncbi:MAG: MotA/TolQ/ExbB proton channel family protein [Opitutales bacterium]|nr:MotA/TolQ/ExbB proton channel family protein [Opitutales bacterium]
MEAFFKEAFMYFKSGGALMLPLLALAAYLYYCAFMLFFKLARIMRACKSPDSIMENLREFFGGESFDLRRDKEQIKPRFDALRREIMPPVSRALSTIKILAAVAPLMGLLGTVSGMALALSEIGGGASGVAEGVSLALITTQCGLSIALPALVIAMFCSMLRQKILVNLSRCESDLILEGAEK